MRRRVRWAAFLVAMVLFAVAENKAMAGCINNRNSEMYCDASGNSCYCAGRGDGCSACFNTGGGGWSLCYYDVRTGDMNCTYQN